MHGPAVSPDSLGFTGERRCTSGVQETAQEFSPAFLFSSWYLYRQGKVLELELAHSPSLTFLKFPTLTENILHVSQDRMPKFTSSKSLQELKIQSREVSASGILPLTCAALSANTYIMCASLFIHSAQVRLSP